MLSKLRILRAVNVWASISWLCLVSCEQSTSLYPEPIAAPSRSLPGREIMKMQGITSIHYIDYDSVVVNGSSDKAFAPYVEYHIDTTRCRIDQYYLGTPHWNTTVYDLGQFIAWNYSSGTLTYPQLPDLRAACESSFQARLGSWLNSPIEFVGTEYIGGKFCNVFRDSTGRQEWVWIEHRLPIQRRRESVNRGIHQITVEQKRQIEINGQFQDSLFEPPK